MFQLREADEGVGRANQAAHVLGERNRINGVPVGQAHGLPDIVGEAAGLHLEAPAKRHRLGPRDQGITHFLDQFRKQRRGLRRERGSSAEMTRPSRTSWRSWSQLGIYVSACNRSRRCGSTATRQFGKGGIQPRSWALDRTSGVESEVTRSRGR